jgi:hypothetical protein
VVGGAAAPVVAGAVFVDAVVAGAGPAAPAKSPAPAGRLGAARPAATTKATRAADVTAHHRKYHGLVRATAGAGTVVGPGIGAHGVGAHGGGACGMGVVGIGG